MGRLGADGLEEGESAALASIASALGRFFKLGGSGGITAYGEYTLSLSVVGEASTEGPTTSVTVEHVGCE